MTRTEGCSKTKEKPKPTELTTEEKTNSAATLQSRQLATNNAKLVLAKLAVMLRSTADFRAFPLQLG